MRMERYLCKIHISHTCSEQSRMLIPGSDTTLLVIILSIIFAFAMWYEMLWFLWAQPQQQSSFWKFTGNFFLPELLPSEKKPTLCRRQWWCNSWLIVDILSRIAKDFVDQNLKPTSLSSTRVILPGTTLHAKS